MKNIKSILFISVLVLTLILTGVSVSASATSTRPRPVQNLKVVGNGVTARLSWDKQDADIYFIRRLTGGQYKNIGYTTYNTFVDNDMNQNDYNYYWVIPANKVGNIYSVGSCINHVQAPGKNVPKPDRYKTDPAWNYKVAGLVNNHRIANRLRPLVHVTGGSMFNGTNVRAKELMSSFSHTRPNGTDCWTAYMENGFQFEGAAAENIAIVHQSAGGMAAAIRGFNLLKASPGHNRNMLKPDITHMSFGLIYDTQTGYMYIVHFFAKPAK
ncbi:MAG: CAP domain-containing protein [Saccharofermentanales bacterium]|jgi:hypothetical protein